jgi:hypothetical protein
MCRYEKPTFKILAFISYFITQILTKLTKTDYNLPQIVTKSKILSINLAYYIDFSLSQGNIKFEPSHGGTVGLIQVPNATYKLQKEFLQTTIIGAYLESIYPVISFRVTSFNHASNFCVQESFTYDGTPFPYVNTF